MFLSIGTVIGEGGSRSNIRRAFVAVLFLAFVLQAQIAAGHFHFSINDTLAQGVAASDRDGKAPGNPAQAPCAACQLVSTAKTFLSSGSVALTLPAFTIVGVVGFAGTLFIRQALDFSWRSRAPPSY